LPYCSNNPFKKAGEAVEMTPLSDDKLKISLDRQDMDELGLVYKNMEYSDKSTRQALMRLLRQAGSETGFSPLGGKLFIEVYKNGEGGCDIYFTRIADLKRLAPALFEFENAEDLIECALRAHALYTHRIFRSSLYRINGKYRLLVDFLDYSDKLSVYFIAEYGKKLGDDEICAAHTAEHGEELIADTALETLAKHFGTVNS
jgi:negative regulator of genetic competence, sporulation and motility